MKSLYFKYFTVWSICDVTLIWEGTRKRNNHDINLSPHTNRCRWARNAPQIANHVIHTHSTNETAKSSRMITFQRQETGLEAVNMIARQRS